MAFAVTVSFAAIPAVRVTAAGPAVVGVSIAPVDYLTGAPQTDASYTTHGNRIAYRISYSCTVATCTDTTVTLPPHGLDPTYAQFRMHAPVLNEWTAPFTGATIDGNADDGVTVHLGDLPPGDARSFVVVYGTNAGVDSNTTRVWNAAYFPPGHQIEMSATIASANSDNTATANAAPVTWNIIVRNPTISKLGPGPIDADTQATYEVRVNSQCLMPIGGGYYRARGQYLCAKSFTVVDQLPGQADYVSSSHGGVYDSGAHTVTWTVSGVDAAVGFAQSRTVTVSYPAANFPEGDGGADFVVQVTNGVSLDMTYLDDSARTAATTYPHNVGRTTPFAKATASEKDAGGSLGLDGNVRLMPVPPDTAGYVCPSSGQDDWGRACTPGQPVAAFAANAGFWQIIANNQANVPGVAVIEDDLDHADAPVWRIESNLAGPTIEYTLDNGTTGTSTAAVVDAPAGRYFTHVRVTSPELAGPNLVPTGTASTAFRVRMHFRVATTAPIGQERTNTLTATMTYPDYPELDDVAFTRSRTIRFVETPTTTLKPRFFARFVGDPVVEGPGGGAAVPGRDVTFNVRGSTDRMPADVDITPQYVFVAPEGWTVIPDSASFPAGSVPAGVTFSYRTVTIGGVAREAVVASWPSTVSFGRNTTWPTMSVIAQPTFAVAAGTVSRANFYITDSRNTWGNTQATYEVAFQDGADLDGDLNTAEWFTSTQQDVAVSSTDGLLPLKEICRVDPDATDGCEWISDPDVLVGVSPTAEDIRYRVTLRNTGNSVLDEVVGYDVLPHIGDTGLLAGTAASPRGSTVPLTLSAVSSVSPNLTLSYSTSTNPCRDEVYPSAPACVAGWSAPAAGALAVRMVADVPLGPGESVSFEYTAAIEPGATDGAIACNSVAVVTDRTEASEPRSVCATAQEADLILSVPDRLPLQVGRPGVIPFEVENLGGAAQSRMTVTIDLPEGLTATTLTVDGWRCVPGGTHPAGTAVGPETLRCQSANPDETPRPVNMGESELLALPVVPDATVGDERLCLAGAVEGPMYDPQPGNNEDDSCMTVAALAAGGELEMTKTDGRSVVAVGDEYIYALTIANTLVAERIDDLAIIDTLPAGVVFVGASDGGTVSGQAPDGTGGTVSWTPVDLAAAGIPSADGDVETGAPGSSVTRTVTVRVDPAASGDVINTAVALAPDPANPEATLSAVDDDTDALRRLTVDKTSSAVAPGVRGGDVVTYTVTLLNSGTAHYQAASPAVLVDDLSGVLDDADFVAGSATVDTGSGPQSIADPIAGELRWSGPLDAGDAAVLSYDVVVNDGSTGDLVLTNVAFSDDDSASCNAATELDENGLSCATSTDLFAPVLDKNLISSAQNDDGTWTIVYGLDVDNLNASSAATYDLTDELRFGTGIDVLAASVTEAPADVTLEAWSGIGPIAAAVTVPAGAQHHYEITVVADANAVGGTAAATCVDGVAGGFGNQASIDLGPIGVQDAWACTSPVEPTVTKSASPVAQNPDGTWTVTYSVTVSNPHLSPGGGLSYLIEDAVDFPVGVNVLDVTASGPAGASINSGFDGSSDRALLTAPDRVPVAVDVATPSTRTYTITVVTEVPPGAVADPSERACAPAGTGGYVNDVELSSNDSVLATDSACTPVVEQPTPTISKSVVSTSVDSGTGYWTLTYQVRVTNPDPSASTLYTLVDEFQFAPDASVVLVDVEATGGVASGSWNGASDTALAIEVALPGGAVHTYDITVVVDPAAVDAETPEADCRLDSGEEGSGLRNVATLLAGTVTPLPFAVACEALTDPSVAKTVAGLPMQNPTTGVWTLEYQVVVTNRSTTTVPGGIPYLLVDELGLPDGVILESVDVTGPDGATVDPAFDGVVHTSLATHSIGAAADDNTPERQIYNVTVGFSVPGGFTASAACDPVQGPGGLRNLVEITVGARTSADVACVDLPDVPVPGVHKEVVSQSQRPDGTWDLEYRVTVANPDGAITTAYDLTDQFALGDGMTIVEAPQVAGPAGVAIDGDWDGQTETTVGEQILLLGGGSHVYTMNAVVDAGSVAGSAAAGDCVVAFDETGSGFTNDAAISTGPAQRASTACVQAWDPAVAKVVNGTPILQPDGSWIVRYVVTVTNPSSTAALRYGLTDELAFPAGTVVLESEVDARLGGPVANDSWDGAADTTVVTPGQLLPPSDVHVFDVTVRARLAADAESTPGGWHNAVIVLSGVDGAVTAVADAAADIELPALAIDKTVTAPTVVQIGDAVDYSITIQNVGVGDYTALHPAAVWDDLSGILDDGDLVSAPVASAGDVLVGGDRLRWREPLAAGDSVTITYRLETARGGDAQLDNVAFAAAPHEADPDTPALADCGADPTCSSTHTAMPALAIAKTASASLVDPSEPVHYTVRVTNTGEAALTNAVPARITDDLADVFADATYAGDAHADIGDVAVTGSTLNWSGALTPGQTATITYSVVIDADAGGASLLNMATSTATIAALSLAGDPISGVASVTTSVRSETPPDPDPHPDRDDDGLLDDEEIYEYGTDPNVPNAASYGLTKYVPLSPTRILDTRERLGWSGGMPGAAATITLPVLGHGGVPNDPEIKAVVFNLTATEGSGIGYVTAYPSGIDKPVVSNLNVDRIGETIPNLVTVPVGPDGSVEIFTLFPTHLVADVAGYYRRSADSTDGRLQPVTPARILDTRAASAIGHDGDKPEARETVTLQVAGRGGVPEKGAAAVVLTLTATEATARGFVTAWPGGEERPWASNVNLDRVGQTIANQVIVPLGPDGTVQLYTQSGTHLVADVTGWFTDTTAESSFEGLFVPIEPVRKLDTRLAGHKAEADGTVTVFTLPGTIPGVAAAAAALNATATETDGPGYVTAFPTGIDVPFTSVLNLDGPDETIADHVIAPVNDGNLALYSYAGAHLVADVVGWYRE